MAEIGKINELIGAHEYVLRSLHLFIAILCERDLRLPRTSTVDGSLGLSYRK